MKMFKLSMYVAALSGAMMGVGVGGCGLEGVTWPLVAGAGALLWLARGGAAQ